MKSAIRNSPIDLSFIKIQLKKILSFSKVQEDPKTWVLISLNKVEVFCNEMIENQKNVDQHSIVKSLELILSIYIKEKTEDKELQRKKLRKADKLIFLQLSNRQQEIELHKRNITSTRGADPQLNSICELVHLCRWGTKNMPISSSKKTASLSSIKSSLQKKRDHFFYSRTFKKSWSWRAQIYRNYDFFYKHSIW